MVSFYFVLKKTENLCNIKLSERPSGLKMFTFFPLVGKLVNKNVFKGLFGVTTFPAALSLSKCGHTHGKVAH